MELEFIFCQLAVEGAVLKSGFSPSQLVHDGSPIPAVKRGAVAATYVDGVAVVGSSFTHLPAEILARDNCLSALNVYFYFNLSRHGGHPYQRLQSNLTEKDLSTLRDAKIMILEENESFAGTHSYIEALRELLAKPQ